jgi:hypothetical protein
MLDFEVQRFTRKCFVTDSILQPGDEFYSALISEGAHVVRRDYSASAWPGPPEGTVGWWRSQVPDVLSRKAHWAPNDVILHYFEQMCEDDDQADMRYVLTLLMVRRRIVRLEDTEKDAQEREVFVLYCPRNEREYRVPVSIPTEERAEEIQNYLAELLLAGNP